MPTSTASRTSSARTTSTSASDTPGIPSGIRGGYLNLVVTWLVQALLVPLLLHRLGRDAYGLYATLTSIVGYFALLTFGSALTVPRYVADHAARGDDDGLSAFVSTYFVLHLAVAGVGVLAGWVVGPLLVNLIDVPATLLRTVLPAWRFVVLGWALGLAGGLFQSFLVGLGDVALANLANSLRTVLTLLVAAMILRAGGDLEALLAALMIAAVVGSALVYSMLRMRHPKILIRPSLARRATLRATLRPAALFFLMQIAALAVTGTDNIIIGSVLGVGQVAAYAVAFQLWSLVLAMLWSGVDALLPFFTRWDVFGDRAQIQHAFVSATRYTFAGAVLGAIVLTAFGPSLVRWWIGTQIAMPQGVLTVFAAMLLTATPIHTAALLLTGLGRHRPIAWGGATEALLNVAISLALVRPLGVLGVALGTLISGMLTNAWIAPSNAAREVGLGWSSYVRQALLPAVPPAVLAGFPAWLMTRNFETGSPPMAAGLAIIVPLYLATFWFVSLDGADRREAMALIRR